MTQEQLRSTLDDLREELADVDRLDPQVRAQLEQTLKEIHELLDQESDTQVGDVTPSSDRLSEAAGHFEESHPNVALLLGRLADTLSQMGI